MGVILKNTELFALRWQLCATVACLGNSQIYISERSGCMYTVQYSQCNWLNIYGYKGSTNWPIGYLAIGLEPENLNYICNRGGKLEWEKDEGLCECKIKSKDSFIPVSQDNNVPVRPQQR